MNQPQISAFSIAFAKHLRGVMAERGIKLRALATHMDRSIGFVSERTGGVRPVDTDILDAVADLAGIDARDLVAQVATRMQWEEVGREDVGLGKAPEEWSSVGAGAAGQTVAPLKDIDIFYVDNSVFAELAKATQAEATETVAARVEAYNEAIFQYVERFADATVKEELRAAKERDAIHLSDEEYAELEAIAKDHDGKPIAEVGQAFAEWWARYQNVGGIFIVGEAGSGKSGAMGRSAVTGSFKRRAGKPDPSSFDEPAAARDEDREKPRMD